MMRSFRQTVAGTEIDVISDGEGPRLTILHRDTGRAGWTGLHARLAKRFTVKDLARTELGSQVICEDRELLYEEAPQAYENFQKKKDGTVKVILKP